MVGEHHNNTSRVQPAFWFEQERGTGSNCRPKSGDLASSLPIAQVRIMSSGPNQPFCYLGSLIDQWSVCELRRVGTGHS